MSPCGRKKNIGAFFFFTEAKKKSKTNNLTNYVLRLEYI